MSVRTLATLLCLWCAQSIAQGFAGLGADVDGFSVPTSGTLFSFPRDHGAHPDFRIEWWYVTANLTAADGTPYGLQWTLFRTALAPNTTEGWDDPQVWMGHAAITTPDQHFVAERLARGGIGQAGVTAAPFSAWIDEWNLSGRSDWSELSMSAQGPQFGYDVQLTTDRELVFHGDNGFSVKSSDGQASYYYSQPFFEVSGTLHLPEGSVEITGSAWLDREWSSQPLSEDQTGWDWFSLSFDDGAKMMGFQLRQTDGSVYTSGSWIAVDGTVTAIQNDELQFNELTRTSVAGRQIPTIWQVELPNRGVDVTVSAINSDAWMDTSVSYWEGPITVEGTHAGIGYLEMTGYEENR